MSRRLQFALLFLIGAVTSYFGGAAYVLHFELGRLLFPRAPADAGPSPKATVSFTGRLGSELLLRRYGEQVGGCVVLFPGQHGGAATYIPSYVAAGLEVFAMAYPGQDGAFGHTDLEEIENLVGQALVSVERSCKPERTVLVGVSLGATLASYARTSPRVAGLVLVSATPSLSSAINVRLRSNWYTAPLALLPLEALLPHDYSLVEGLRQHPGVKVVVFQGTLDEQTPLKLLYKPNALPEGTEVMPVTNGTHSNTFSLSQEAQVAHTLRMLRHE